MLEKIDPPASHEMLGLYVSARSEYATALAAVATAARHDLMHLAGHRHHRAMQCDLSCHAERSVPRRSGAYPRFVDTGVVYAASASLSV